MFLLPVVLMACQKEVKREVPPADHDIVLRFKPVVDLDTEELEFNTATYQNAFNESFTVSAFKFYIHGIELLNTDSSKVYKVEPDQYYLIDLADPNTAKLELAVSSYPYNAIAFTLGVDSVRNVSGAQTGALDPARGMFWTWDIGYIMAKLEGTSPASTAPANTFMYHIGGFRKVESVIKKIIVPFPQGKVDMQPGKLTQIWVTADAWDWFNSTHAVRISDHSGVMMPGALAMEIADNYSKMFTVTEINNN